jgi:hypothetical protein
MFGTIPDTHSNVAEAATAVVLVVSTTAFYTMGIAAALTNLPAIVCGMAVGHTAIKKLLDLSLLAFEKYSATDNDQLSTTHNHDHTETHDHHHDQPIEEL